MLFGGECILEIDGTLHPHEVLTIEPASRQIRVSAVIPAFAMRPLYQRLAGTHGGHRERGLTPLIGKSSSIDWRSHRRRVVSWMDGTESRTR